MNFISIFFSFWNISEICSLIIFFSYAHFDNYYSKEYSTREFFPEIKHMQAQLQLCCLKLSLVYTGKTRDKTLQFFVYRAIFQSTMQLLSTYLQDLKMFLLPAYFKQIGMFQSRNFNLWKKAPYNYFTFFLIFSLLSIELTNTETIKKSLTNIGKI